MIRKLLILVASAIAFAAFAAPAQTITRFDCKRVITPAEWRAVLGTSIRVHYDHKALDCVWFHRRLGKEPAGLISGYPANSKSWRQIYRSEPTETRPLIPCGEDDVTRTRLRSFGSEFAWSVEHASFVEPGKDPDCPPAKAPYGTDRTVYVVHHGRLLMMNSGDDYRTPVSLGASFAQLEQLAHMAIRRF